MCIIVCCLSFMLESPILFVFTLILHKQTYIEYFNLKSTVTPAGPLENKPANWNKVFFSFAKIRKHEPFKVFFEQPIAKFEQINCLWTFFFITPIETIMLANTPFPSKQFLTFFFILKFSIYQKQKPFHILFLMDLWTGSWKALIFNSGLF